MSRLTVRHCASAGLQVSLGRRDAYKNLQFPHSKNSGNCRRAVCFDGRALKINF
jgi:hypothetical protein